MPTYEIQLPKGGTFEVESDTDPTPDSLEAITAAMGDAGSDTPPAHPELKAQWEKAGIVERAKLLLTHYPAASVPVMEEAQKPSVHLPRIETDAGGVKGVGAGLVNAAEGAIEGLSAPANAPFMAAGSALGVAKASTALARQALASMAGYFGVQMGRGAVEQARSAGDVLDNPDATTAQKVEAVAAPVLTGAGAALAALGTAIELAPDAKALAAKITGKTPVDAIAALREEAMNAKAEEQKAALEHAAEELERQQVRATDFTKAKVEEAGQTVKDNQLGQGESMTFENPLTAQETKLDVLDKNAVRERGRISSAKEAATPTVDDGSLPESLDMSPQALRMYEEYGGVDPVLMARLASTAGGAAYGASTGTDGEDKMQRAVEFGALGFLLGKFGPRMVKGAAEAATGIGANLDAIKRTMAGESAPRTTAASEDSGNAVVRYASAPIAAKLDAAYRAGQVLGEHVKDKEFSKKLGAVLVEDRLKAIKDGLTRAATAATDPLVASNLRNQANSVSTVIGGADSPFATEADYRAALADPEIQSAIGRHKEILQPIAEAMHLKTGGQVAQPGIDTQAFVNLKAILGEEEAGAAIAATPPRTQRQGDLTNPMERRTVFGRTAKGTAEKYELDYDAIARRMVESNYEESAKRDMYAQLEADGLGADVPLGQKPPDFGGYGAVKLPLEARGRGEPPRNFYVRSDIAKEVTNALDTQTSLVSETAAQVARGLNLIQLTGPTDAVFHSANIVSALANAPSAGNVLQQIGAKIPGVNIAGALYRLAQANQRRVANSPEVQEQLVNLGKIGALRPENEGLISALDKSARLALDGVFDELVQSGLAVDTEHARREFINQVGQYNSRLQGTLGRMAKEIGMAPFIVAGKTFNRNALRAVTGAPGVETTGPAATARLWATNIAGLVTGVVVLPAIANYLTTGQVAGRPGTPVGAIDTGKDDDKGRHITVDPQRWTNVRRGMRITGLSALMEGIKNDKDGDRITGEAVRDIVWGQLHPWVGPAPTAAVIAITGYSPTGFREAKQLNPDAKFPTASQQGENLKAAFEESYPVFGAAVDAKQHGQGPLTGIALSLAGAAGVRSVSDYTPEQARAETAVETAKRASTERYAQAQDEYRKLSGLKPSERAEPLMRLQAKDPILFEKVLNEFEYQMKGLTPAQRVAARLGVQDGSRARYIAAELAQHHTPESKKEYLSGLITAEVLTDDVADQVAELIGTTEPATK